MHISLVDNSKCAQETVFILNFKTFNMLYVKLFEMVYVPPALSMKIPQ